MTAARKEVWNIFIFQQYTNKAMKQSILMADWG